MNVSASTTCGTDEQNPVAFSCSDDEAKVSLDIEAFSIRLTTTQVIRSRVGGGALGDNNLGFLFQRLLQRIFGKTVADMGSGGVDSNFLHGGNLFRKREGR